MPKKITEEQRTELVRRIRLAMNGRNYLTKDQLRKAIMIYFQVDSIPSMDGHIKNLELRGFIQRTPPNPEGKWNKTYTLRTENQELTTEEKNILQAKQEGETT